MIFCRAAGSAGPSSTTRPSSMHITRLAKPSARSRSCSTRSAVVPSPTTMRSDSIHRLDGDRREAERHLVQEQHHRVAHERPADRGRLLLAAGEAAGPPSPQRHEQRERLEHGVDVPAAGPARGGAHPQVLLDRQAGEQPAPLRNERDAHPHAPVGGHAGDVAGRRARPCRRRRLVRAGDRAQQGRLAGTVRAHERERLARIERERDARAPPAAGRGRPSSRVDREQAHATRVPR